jgi:hypothetical protein
MKSIALKFKVPDVPTVSDSTKDAITQEFAVVSQRKLQEIWKPYILLREKVSIETQGCCVSIMDDWECAIFGNSLLNCLLGLSLVHQFLNNHFNKPVGFMLIEPPMKIQTVDAMIAREKRRTRALTSLKFLGAALIGGLIGHYLNSLLALLRSLGG